MLRDALNSWTKTDSGNDEVEYTRETAQGEEVITARRKDNGKFDLIFYEGGDHNTTMRNLARPEANDELEMYMRDH